MKIPNDLARFWVGICALGLFLACAQRLESIPSQERELRVREVPCTCEDGSATSIMIYDEPWVPSEDDTVEQPQDAT
jgi:hypothetical protein